MRINRFLAKSLGISRRRADDLVKSGRVKINSRVVNNFVDVESEDIVEVDGKRVQIDKGDVYFAFYKPPFVISSNKDDNNRVTVCDFFKEIDQKLVCVGRLDYLSEGLLIVTSDGKFANLLMHPKFKVRKTYLVKTSEELDSSLIERMSKGVMLEDGFFRPLAIKKTKNPEWIVISIDTGRNRIIRRFLKFFDVKIDKLKRVAIGDIELGDLQKGKYRNLTNREINNIKKQVYFKNATTR